MRIDELRHPEDQEQQPESNLPQEDRRFLNEKFREAVRFTLEFLGLESTYGNFKKYDGIIDFVSFYSSKKNPKITAIFYILNAQGEKISLPEEGGMFATVGMEFDEPGASCEVEKMEKHGFKFKRWF